MAGRNAVHFIKGETMESWDEEKSNCMKKGFPEEETVTCTICPNGCQVKWDEAMNTYSGNRCLRGISFAEQERIKPMRTVTTTVKTAAGEKILLPVRTAAAVDRNRVRAVVEKLKDVRAEKSLNTGDEVYRMKLDGNDVSIIATASL